MSITKPIARKHAEPLSAEFQPIIPLSTDASPLPSHAPRTMQEHDLMRQDHLYRLKSLASRYIAQLGRFDPLVVDAINRMHWVLNVWDMYAGYCYGDPSNYAKAVRFFCYGSGRQTVDTVFLDIRYSVQYKVNELVFAQKRAESQHQYTAVAARVLQYA